MNPELKGELFDAWQKMQNTLARVNELKEARKAKLTQEEAFQMDVAISDAEWDSYHAYKTFHETVQKKRSEA